MLDKQLAALGRAPGQLPEVFAQWHLAMSRETDWARHERDLVRQLVGRAATRPAWCWPTPSPPPSASPP